MTGRALLTRLWLAASALWVVMWGVISEIPGCILGNIDSSWCEFHLPRGDWGYWAAIVLSMPIGGGLLGVAALWLMRRSTKQ